jgi:hypothetical protein
MANEILLNFTSPCGAYGLTFEDDGKVAYAYLLWKDDIIGDVWLYNRCPTPDIPEWTDRTNIPFANPREFVGEGAHLTRGIQPADVIVDWEYKCDKPVAYVYLFQKLFGVVGVGDKPGYARAAVKNGPLARILEVKE